MRNKTDTPENCSPRVTPSAPWRVKEVQALEAYRLYIKFVDDVEGYLDLSCLISSKEAGVFVALRDPQVFKNVYLDLGAVTWPGELDLAPDAMYEEIKKKGEWVVQ